MGTNWPDFIDEAYRVVRVEHGLSPDPGPDPPRTQGRSPGAPSRLSPSIGHLSLFNQYVQQRNLPVEWVYKDSAGEGTKTTPIWVVRAMVDGKCLGRGRGSTKKAARNEAAKEGLQQMGVYVPCVAPSPALAAFGHCVLMATQTALYAGGLRTYGPPSDFGRMSPADTSVGQPALV